MTYQQQLTEMRDWALRVGVTPESYDRLFMLRLHAGVDAMYAGEFEGLLRARAQVSEETWDNYRMLGVTGLWEQDNLKRAKGAFRKAIRRLYEEAKLKGDQEAALAGGGGHAGADVGAAPD